jgi:hypothetical protein
MKKIIKEFNGVNNLELLEAIFSNFFYGFIGASLIVFISLRFDIGVFFSYLIYYFYLGKIVNRPKYVTSLGKFIVFPIPTCFGAFLGYKLSPLLINLIQ